MPKITNHDSKVRSELMHKYSNQSATNMRIRRQVKVLSWELAIKMSYACKRSVDIAVSAVMLVLLSPIFLLTSIGIYAQDRGAILYPQTRVGKNGIHFRMLKFRSMVTGAEKLKESLSEQNESSDGVIFKMKNDPRITKYGRFIRKFSIDELPQFFNVLKGEMSLVGPRPPLPNEVAQYTLQDRKRLHVTPGITCIWQISGRSDIPFSQQVQLDREYIKSQSVLLDFIILIKTIPVVILGKGGY